MSVARLDDRSWDTAVLAVREPVAVLFWADWCLPSKTAVESVEALSSAHQVALRVGLMNVDDNPRTTERYGIQGLPTLIVFRNAEPAERRVGLMSRADMVRLLQRHG